MSHGSKDTVCVNLIVKHFWFTSKRLYLVKTNNLIKF